MATVDDLPSALKFFAALGCGLMAGVFFAFSAFVMNGLGRLAPPQGIAAMQSINITAVTPLFMAALFGTAIACVSLAISALTHRHQPGAGFLLAGSLLYLIGVVLVTMIFNVPLNDALASVDPGSAHGESLWKHYLDAWTVWNHVRAATALAATAALVLALCDRVVRPV